MIYSIDNK